jgi:hypothetical protein
MAHGVFLLLKVSCIVFIFSSLIPVYPVSQSLHAMRTRFYVAPAKASKHTQAVKKKAKRPQLSQEASAAIRARRHQASQNYKKGLGEAWSSIDRVVEELAITHHKSIRRVQSELHMGCQMSSQARKKTNAWNAFCWKKSQDKENGEVYTSDSIFRH